MKAGQSRALLCFWRGAEETKQEKEEREKSEVEEEKTKKKNSSPLFPFRSRKKTVSSLCRALALAPSLLYPPFFSGGIAFIFRTSRKVRCAPMEPEWLRASVEKKEPTQATMLT
jgi:hypothetical protein